MREASFLPRKTAQKHCLKIQLGERSGRFVCVFGDETCDSYDYTFWILMGMKSDFRWPWHHRMKSPGWRCRCKTKSQNKVGWNMQLAFSRLRLVEVVFFCKVHCKHVNLGISNVLAWQISSFNETPRRMTTRCGMLFSQFGSTLLLSFYCISKEATGNNSALFWAQTHF